MANELLLQTRDQRYAAKIYDLVAEIAHLDASERNAHLDASERNKYGGMALKLPILIRTAGLAQALAFVEARGVEVQKKLLDHLAQAVGYATGKELFGKSRSAELRDYIRLTHEVLAALIWFRRYAQSILDIEPGTDAGGDSND